MKFYTLTEVKLIESDFNRWLKLTFDDGSTAMIETPGGLTGSLIGGVGAYRAIFDAAARKVGGWRSINNLNQFVGLKFCEADFEKIGISRKEGFHNEF